MLKIKLILYYSLSSYIIFAMDENYNLRENQPTKTTKKSDITQQRQRLPHEIDPKTGYSEFERSIQDAYNDRQNNSSLKLHDSLQRARDLYNKSRRAYASPEEIFASIKKRYQSGHLSDLYGLKGNHDEHAQILLQDLNSIDPFLYKAFVDSFYDVKQKSKSTPKITDKDFLNWLQKNPEYIINPSIITKKPNEKTPLEDAIDLSNKEVIEGIIEIAKKNKISSEQLIAPIKEEIIKISKKDGQEKVTQYLDKIKNIGVPELTKIIYKNILRPELEWALENNDLETGKDVLNLAIENGISIEFLSKPLIDNYKKLAKSSQAYLQKIYDLENSELSNYIYEQLSEAVRP